MASERVMDDDEREFYDTLGNGTYRIIEQLGSGSFGKILGGFNISTNEKVALKVVDKVNAVVYNREAYFSTLLRGHSNIIHTSKAYTVVNKKNASKYGVLVLERMDEDLMDYLLAKGSLSEKETKIIFQDICKAIAHCHARGVAHLDLKPDNILIRYLDANRPGQNPDRKIEIKLCDFGFALEWKREQVVDGKHVKFGSENYRAPEASGSHWRNFEADKADIWSLGVTLFIMITGFYPFYRVKNSWIAEDLTVLNKYCKDDLCYNLVSSMLQLTPTARPSINEVLEHPWFSD